MDEIDITADLVDGSDGALGDVASTAAAIGAARQGEVDDAAPASKQAGVVHTNEVTAQIKQPETSLRDQLSSAFKGPEEQKPAEQAPAATVPALTKDSEGRYRQADGTFASNEQVTAFEAAKAAPAQNTTQEQAPTFISRMTPLEREQYNALPAETQEFVGRTMEAVDSQATRFGEYGIIEQSLIGPRRDAWASNGMTPAVALNQLFALSDFATQNPKDFVLWFADQQKIDLDAALDERDAACCKTWTPKYAPCKAKSTNCNSTSISRRVGMYKRKSRLTCKQWKRSRKRRTGLESLCVRTLPT
jgi:hypothetical protein